MGPGTKDYGALSLAVQYYADPYIVANVPPNCFMPRPKVGSAVIRLTRHREPPVDVRDEKLMFRLIRASFNQRRKTLANGLNNSPELSFSKEEIQRTIESCGFSGRYPGRDTDAGGLCETGKCPCRRKYRKRITTAVSADLIAVCHQLEFHAQHFRGPFTHEHTLHENLKVIHDGTNPLHPVQY